MNGWFRAIAGRAGFLQRASEVRAWMAATCPLLLPAAARRDLRDNANLRLLLSFLLAPDANCIDIGCSRGDVLKEMLRVAPQGRHIAYEPLPEFHEVLVREFPSVEVRQAALSDHRSEERFVRVVGHPGYSGFRRRAYPGKPRLEEIKVRVEDLDSSLPEGYVPALIKLDVEGAEEQVIRGAIETIKVHKPVVVFEHGRGAAGHYGTAPGDIFELLCGRAGLRIFDLDGVGPYDLPTFERAFEHGAPWNFVAHS